MKHLIENNYYFAVFDIEDSPQAFLSLIRPETYFVINQFEDGCFESENKALLPDENYNVALYVKTDNLKIATKVRSDAKLKQMYSDILGFLPIKNNSNAFKTYLYAFQKRNKSFQETALLIENNGYGDCILVQVLIRAGIDSGKLNKSNLTIYHMYRSSYHLSQLFLSDCYNVIYPLTDELSFLGDASQTNELEKLKECNIIRISNNLIRSAYTKIKELASALGVDYDNSLLESVLPFLPIPADIIDKLRLLKQEKDYVVGVQFYTYDDNIAHIGRTYNYELAQRFINLCRDNNIGVVNLSEYAGHILKSDLDVSHLTINELFPVVNQIDIVTGIDSCCGHIAGALQKKNLILLGRIINDSSQRPYSMNYTIVSEKGDVNTITPEDTYRIMMNILEGQLVLSMDVQEIYDYTFDMEYL